MFDKFKKIGELAKLRGQALSLKKALASEEIIIDEEGIRIVMTGDQKVKELTINGIKNQVLVELLNKATKKSQEMAAKKMQAMGTDFGIPGLK